MLYREIIVVCSQIRTKHINALCRKYNFFGAFEVCESYYYHRRVYLSVCPSVPQNIFTLTV